MMRLVRFYLIGTALPLFFLTLVSCAPANGTSSQLLPAAPEQPAPKPDPGPAPHPVPQPQPSHPSAGNYKAALWASIANSSSWTDAVLLEIRTHLSQFERARDKNEFCPNYHLANAYQKENCWLRLVSAVAKFESGFNPSDSFQEANGDWSIGLLALSPSECPNAPSASSLKNPIRNLSCGVKMMARLIDRDGFINGPASARGAGAYWSTLRPPYISGHYHVGKQDRVIGFTRLYRDF